MAHPVLFYPLPKWPILGFQDELHSSISSRRSSGNNPSAAYHSIIKHVNQERGYETATEFLPKRVVTPTPLYAPSINIVKRKFIALFAKVIPASLLLLFMYQPTVERITNIPL